MGATSCFVTDNADLIPAARRAAAGRHPGGGGDRRPGQVRPGASGPADVSVSRTSSPRMPTTGGQARLPVGVRPGVGPEGDRAPHRGISWRGATKGTHGGRRPVSSSSSTATTRWVVSLEKRVAEKMGFKGTYAVTGQTYPRKIDAQVMDVLSGVAASSHKAATPTCGCLRTRKEIEEPFERGADRLFGNGLQAQPDAERAHLRAGEVRDEPADERPADAGHAVDGNARSTTAPTAGCCYRRRFWRSTGCC